MPIPYEWLYELRPIPIREKVLEEVARHLAKELGGWPPRVLEWHSPADEARFRPLFEEPVRPADSVYRYAFRMVRLELQREYEAIDHAMRNEEWRAHAPAERDYESVQLLVRWLLDILLAVREHSGQKLTRDDLVRAVDLLEKQLLPRLLA